MLSRVPTRTCCCCVPSRAGVVVFALLGVFFGSLITGFSCLRMKNTDGSKTSLIIEAIVFGILAFVSLMGLIGAFARRLGLIKFYFAMLLVHFIVSFAIGVYAVFKVFHDASGYVQSCVGDHGGPDSSKVCTDADSITKAIVICMFMLLWFFEIWGCVIVSSYARQLREEKTAERVVKDTEAW